MFDLNKLVNKAMAEHEELKSDFREKVDAVEDADIANAQTQRESLLVKIKRTEQYIARLTVAIRKQDIGEFGFCKDCGIDIEPKRLAMLPDAPCCVDCQQIREQKRYAA